jgi:drug/metabolite transporter (DMT)-like permease
MNATAVSVPDYHRQRALGTILTIVSAIVFSTAGYFTRLIPLDTWTILFWRGLFGGLFIGGFVVWRHRRDTMACLLGIGRPGLVVAALSALATILFINAFRLTSVADVTVIFATTPFLTAGLTWLWFGEQERWTTIAASAAALCGVAVMVGGAAMEGHIAGDLMASGTTLCIAIAMVMIRRHGATPMLPAVCLSAFLVSLGVCPFARPGAATMQDIVNLFLFGTTQFGLGLLLLTLGMRLISATESALLGLIETPLAPLWVWLAFGETPSAATLAGGAIVMAAVSGQIFTSGRPPAPRIGTAGPRDLTARVREGAFRDDAGDPKEDVPARLIEP